MTAYDIEVNERTDVSEYRWKTTMLLALLLGIMAAPSIGGSVIIGLTSTEQYGWQKIYEYSYWATYSAVVIGALVVLPLSYLSSVAIDRLQDRVGETA